MENLVVPSELNNVKIETIENQAFYNNFNLKNVTLPEGIKIIGAGAFENCFNLEPVTIPSTVEEIWSGAFDGVDTIYLPYHTPEQLNGKKYHQTYGNTNENEIWGAIRAIYGTGENQIIVEDKELIRLYEELENNNTNTNNMNNTNPDKNITTKNDSAKSVKLKVGEKVATVNDISVALDTPAYINSSNNSVLFL